MSISLVVPILSCLKGRLLPDPGSLYTVCGAETAPEAGILEVDTWLCAAAAARDDPDLLSCKHVIPGATCLSVQTWPLEVQLSSVATCKNLKEQCVNVLLPC